MSGKTPCPTWCETDHTREMGHCHFLGEFEHVQVHAYGWLHTPETSVRLTNRRPLSLDAPRITDIEASEAPALAALMASLGHREIGELIREAVELIEDEDEQGGVDRG